MRAVLFSLRCCQNCWQYRTAVFALASSGFFLPADTVTTAAGTHRATFLFLFPARLPLTPLLLRTVLGHTYCLRWFGLTVAAHTGFTHATFTFLFRFVWFVLHIDKLYCSHLHTMDICRILSSTTSYFLAAYSRVFHYCISTFLYLLLFTGLSRLGSLWFHLYSAAAFAHRAGSRQFAHSAVSGSSRCADHCRTLPLLRAAHGSYHTPTPFSNKPTRRAACYATQYAPAAHFRSRTVALTPTFRFVLTP